jgi:hypothetical protein
MGFLADLVARDVAPLQDLLASMDPGALATAADLIEAADIWALAHLANELSILAFVVIAVSEQQSAGIAADIAAERCPLTA